jgi:hypothetical protein
MKKTIKCLIIILLSSTLLSAGYKPIVLDPAYEHDQWQTQPQDHMFNFAVHTASFDGSDKW